MTALRPLTRHTFAAEVLDSILPCLVLFAAPWCAPCLVQEERLQAFLDRCGPGLRAGLLDVDEAGELAARYDVQRIPPVIRR